eukprot:9786312-Ditylum_brightwellii.AAC.1
MKEERKEGKKEGRKRYISNACKTLDTWLVTKKHWDVQQVVKKVAIAGSSNVYEDVKRCAGGFKTKKMRFADDTNFTKEDLGPNHAKEQFDQLGLNFVEEYDKD